MIPKETNCLEDVNNGLLEPLSPMDNSSLSPLLTVDEILGVPLSPAQGTNELPLAAHNNFYFIFSRPPTYCLRP